MRGTEQVDERRPEAASLPVPERLVDGGDRGRRDPRPAGIAHGSVHREPRRADVLVDERRELLADQVRARGLAVRVADPLVCLDDDDRRRVPFRSAVRLRLVRRNRAGAHLEPQRVRNSVSFPRSDFCITPVNSGSPPSIAFVIFFACSRVMCGGSGGTSGSVRTSSTTGVFADSASSHALRMSSPLSQKIPLRPQSSPYFAYSKSGSHCVPMYLGSPSITRCSHVTWFRSWLLKTQKMSRLSSQRSM